ncbi:hypothetical protein ACJ8BV_01905 [Klebsiella pneumoniae]
MDEHTNVNEKPSPKERTTLRTDGFVRNIHSRNPFDVIRADGWCLNVLEKKAGRSCGMHYELYQAHLLGGALDYLDALPLKDRPVLMGAGGKAAYLTLTGEAEEERALEARDVLMSELAANDC